MRCGPGGAACGELLVAAAPDHQAWRDDSQPQAFASRAGRMMGMAAETTFNDGLRAYCMSFAALAWFVSPWALVARTSAMWSVSVSYTHLDVYKRQGLHRLSPRWIVAPVSRQPGHGLGLGPSRVPDHQNAKG